MRQKTVKFNKQGILQLPDNKPVVYQILTPGGKPNYVGSTQRGRVRERLQEHLDDGRIPGEKIWIEQLHSIKEAQQKEQNTISQTKPKYNKRGT